MPAAILEGEELCARMRRVRSRMHTKADVLRVDAQRLLEWRYYVSQYPWTCLGIAAALGFWLTPGPRVMPTVQLAEEAMDEVARRAKASGTLGSVANARSWLRPLGGLAANLAVRSLAGYLSGRLSVGASARGAQTAERSRHDSYR